MGVPRGCLKRTLYCCYSGPELDKTDDGVDVAAAAA